MCLSIVSVQSQEIEEECWYNGKLYRKAGKSYRIRSWKRNDCTESFIYTRANRRIVVITLSEIKIDCNGKNNFRLSDDEGLDYDYCGSDATEMPLYSNSKWISVIKEGKVDLKMKFTRIKVSKNTTTGQPTTSTIVQSTTKPTSVGSTTPISQSSTIAPPQNSCGVPVITPNLDGRTFKIIGGNEAVPNSWPWQAYITDGNAECGATLINNQWLVTAAHCEFFLGSWYAYLGEHDIMSNDGQTKMKVSKFIQHEDYRFKEDHDIALLKLETPVVFSERIQPACLPGGRTEKIGDGAVVTGWGVVNEQTGASSNRLKQASVDFLEPAYCSNPRDETETIDTKYSICAGDLIPNVHDACQGDSGGPLIVKDTVSDSYYLSGIVSSGYGCKGKGIYVRVSEFEDWIMNTINAN